MPEAIQASVAGKLARASVIAGAVLGAAVQAANPVTVPVQLDATTLIMGGTHQVLSVGPKTPEFLFDFVNGIYTDFVGPSGLCAGGSAGCALTAVYTPEQLRPFTGFDDMTLDQSVAAGLANLDDCVRGKPCTVTMSPYTSTAVQPVVDSSKIVYGVSQSAIISGHEKAGLIAHPTTGTVSFVLVSNQNKPNGGLLERFVGAYIPYLGITFNGASPTDSPRDAPLLTVDIARQYDGWTDFPLNPLNALADANALMGALFLHAANLYDDGPAQLQGIYQDTTYYLGPSTLLPLLKPLSLVPLIGMPLAKALDPSWRVLVESGYDRTINPGQPTKARYLYFPNPFKTAVNFVVAIPTGWDDAISYITANPSNRPFHTKPQPLYGVGGPPVYAGAVDPYVPAPPETVGPLVANSAKSFPAQRYSTDAHRRSAGKARAAQPVEGSSSTTWSSRRITAITSSRRSASHSGTVRRQSSADGT